jgi:hypothetical protein
MAEPRAGELSPTPKRTQPPRWFDLRLVLGVALVIGSVLLGAKIVSGARATYRMVAVTRDLAAGTTLRSGDLRRVDVRLPARGAGVYVHDTAGAVGRQLSRALAKGELVPLAAVSEQAAATTLSVPLAAGRAPALHAGQRVELWLSSKQCPSLVLLADVTVQEVHAGSAAVGAASGQDVVLSVPPPLADRVVTALALEDAVVRAGVLAGPAHADANGRLPGLESCTAQPS